MSCMPFPNNKIICFVSDFYITSFLFLYFLRPHNLYHLYLYKIIFISFPMIESCWNFLHLYSVILMFQVFWVNGFTAVNFQVVTITRHASYNIWQPQHKLKTQKGNKSIRPSGIMNTICSSFESHEMPHHLNITTSKNSLIITQLFIWARPTPNFIFHIFQTN